MRFLILLTFSVSSYLSFSQVVINEVCATNADINIDPVFGNFSGWVELFNKGNSQANVGGFWISDDTLFPFKWQLTSNTLIPAGGRLLIWCDQKWDGLHTNFSLNADGESLILSNSSGVAVDNISYPRHPTNTSYARITDGNVQWRIASTATPMLANVQGPANQVQLEPPNFSQTSGRFAGAQSVSLSHPNSTASIHFTLDGSEPTKSSPKFSSAISVNTSKVVKAKAFQDDFLPSETAFNTFLINEHFSFLPTVSLSTKPSYLWDNTVGIYADGTNGIPGNCNGNNMNWNQDWSRHATMEFFDRNGISQVNQSVDIRIGGACSRNFPQKSFVVQPKKKYGSGQIQYPFFPTKRKVTSVGELFLRNSGNDFNTTMFRDAFLQSLGIGQMDLDYMAYQPAILYLNGEYWGIQNIREKIDGDFIESNYGVPKSDVDLLETWENAIEGTNAGWLQYKDSLLLLNPKDPNTFAFIDKHIDVQEYINYLVTEIYVANTDWPGNNVKFWRQRSTNGKFRWILWDLDFGFALYDGASYPTHPTLDFATDSTQVNWPNPAFSTLHIRQVLKNPEFKKRFMASFATAMNTTFHPDRVNQKITEFKTRIQNEIPFHKVRWGGNASDWEYEVQRLRNFSAARHAFMQSYFANFFALDQSILFTATTSPEGAGKISMDGVLSNGMTEAKYYKSLPYRVKAVANAGFRFTGWTITANESETIYIADLGSSWKYLDQGVAPTSDWVLSTFNAGTWLEGNAQLGYGDGDEVTNVGFGGDANNKFITTYFRKTFAIADTTGLTTINASILIDDGAVVYLNGTEVYRNNMPDGVITNSTLALAGSPENVFLNFTINKNLLVPGTNVLAVEVHQVLNTSSDISFDFSATSTKVGNSITYKTPDFEVYDTAFADVEMVANFDALPPISGLVLNEFSAGKSAADNFGEMEDWMELYNGGSNPIDLSDILITDDLTFKNKYTLNKNGQPWILQPDTYQLLWADDQLTQGKEHLPFKLSSSGDDIGIYHVAGFDTLKVADLSYDALSPNTSMARIPNATGPFEITAKITPNATNEFVTGLPDEGMTTHCFFPNPADQYVNIVAQASETSLSIVDMMGKQVLDQQLESKQATNIFIGNIPSGVYVLVLNGQSRKSISRLVVVHGN